MYIYNGSNNGYETMEQRQIEQRMLEILVEEGELEIDPENIDETTPLGKNGFGLNSLNIIQAIIKIEDEFQVDISDSIVMESSLMNFGNVMYLLKESMRSQKVKEKNDSGQS